LDKRHIFWHYFKFNKKKKTAILDTVAVARGQNLHLCVGSLFYLIIIGCHFLSSRLLH